MLGRLHRDERGIALVTGLLVTVVVFSLGLVSVQLSAHSSSQSAFDRKRVQAIHAGEAGLDAFLATLPTTSPTELTCEITPTSLPIAPGAQYRVRATYYSTFPGTAATAIPCSSVASGSVVPAGAVITATGTAVAVGNSRAVSRSMTTLVRLNTVLGGLDKAIFSNSGLNIQNNLTVTGNVGNDAGLYTNGDFSCQNSTVDYGTVEVPLGGATLANSCTVLENLWVRDNILMSGSARVGHNAIAAGCPGNEGCSGSTGSITLQNSARIDNNARSALDCFGCIGSGSGRNVFGTITKHSPSRAPLIVPFPRVNYDADSWRDAGYSGTNSPYSSCSQARSDIEALNGAPGKRVFRVTGNCSVVFSGNNTIRLGGDTALIVDGANANTGACPTPPAPLTCAIGTSNLTRFASVDGTPKTLHLIVPWDSANPCNAFGGDNILIENNTDFVGVNVFLYSPCTVTMRNNNLGLGGQIYGGTVNIANQFQFAYRPITVPGAGQITGFSPDIAYIREVTNPSPAASP